MFRDVDLLTRNAFSLAAPSRRRPGQGLVQTRFAVGHRGKKLLPLYGGVTTGWPLQAVVIIGKCDFLRAHHETSLPQAFLESIKVSLGRLQLEMQIRLQLDCSAADHQIMTKISNPARFRQHLHAKIRCPSPSRRLGVVPPKAAEWASRLVAGAWKGGLHDGAARTGARG